MSGVQCSGLEGFQRLGNEEEIVAKTKAFVDNSTRQKKKVALVTSGGTSVSLEKNTVRAIENFSTGRRGAISAEKFLQAGYNVIYLHRKGCILPFARCVSDCFAANTSFNIMSLFRISEEGLKVAENIPSKVPDAVLAYHSYSENILAISYVRLSEYLISLHLICNVLKPLNRYVLVYLAAAVSDYYIPDSELLLHKIQSSDNSLHIKLHPVPKVVGHLVDTWVPDAYVVTFKLETDPELLDGKAIEALEKYDHHAVVGNIMETRYSSVKIFTAAEKICIDLSQEDSNLGLEIEEKIVHQLSIFHAQFLRE